jgi:hypothetical protein
VKLVFGALSGVAASKLHGVEVLKLWDTVWRCKRTGPRKCYFFNINNNLMKHTERFVTAYFSSGHGAPLARRAALVLVIVPRYAALLGLLLLILGPASIVHAICELERGVLQRGKANRISKLSVSWRVRLPRSQASDERAARIARHVAEIC